MRHFVFNLKEGSSIEDALLELEPLFPDIYEVDDPLHGTVVIGGYSDIEEIPENFTHVILKQSAPIEEIDWQEQWSTFSPDFYHGLAHVDLSPFGGPVLKLKPGGGFGDFSHPTTRLVLALMSSLVKDRDVVDIGCGSGILSIAAILLGAKRAWGIDIDPQALEHTLENAQLNQTQEHIQCANAINPKWPIEEPYVIMMNMIETEQLAAWEAASTLHSKRAYIITSGILTMDKEDYLQLTKQWNWILKESKEEEDWIGFVFTQNIQS